MDFGGQEATLGRRFRSSALVSTTLEGLAQAIDHLDLPIDNGVLTDAFVLADRLDAKLLAAVGEHDAA